MRDKVIVHGHTYRVIGRKGDMDALHVVAAAIQSRDRNVSFVAGFVTGLIVMALVVITLHWNGILMNVLSRI